MDELYHGRVWSRIALGPSTCDSTHDDAAYQLAASLGDDDDDDDEGK